MSKISDERLAELARRAERYAKACRATGSPVTGQESEDTAAALRELQERRKDTEMALREIQRLSRELKQITSLVGNALTQLAQAYPTELP